MGEWESLFYALPDQIMVLNLSQHLTHLNHAAALHLKMAPETALGRPCFELMHQRSTPHPTCAFARALASGTPVQKEIQDENSGRTFLVTVSPQRNEHGQIIGAIHVSRDVTELKRTQQELAQTSTFLNQVIQAAPLGIVVLDPDGRISSANPQFAAEFDYGQDDLMGAQHAILFAHETERQEIWSILEKEGEVLSREVAWRQGNGRTVPSRLSIRKLFGGGGEYQGVVILCRNIAEEVSMRRQLEQAGKLEAVATLSGGLAHNFNNLLMVILGLTQLMLAKLGPDDPLYPDLREIEQQVQAGQDLTHKLLTCDRGSELGIRPFDINLLVSCTADLFGRTRRDVVIKQELSPGLPPVSANASQIQQVLMNLLINAWQAMPQGGIITLCTREVHLTKWRDLSWDLTPGHFVDLTVKDTGIGMNKETQRRLFEPFFTTKPPGQGTGLGLAYAYRILKHHGGAIRVKSEPGCGTTFSILLPVSTLVPEHCEFPETQVIVGAGTILLVDDEPTLRSVASRLLHKLGYRVLEAADGSEALEIVKSQGQEIDLVLLDQIMPGLTGLQTLERLRKLEPYLPVILCSGNGEITEGRPLSYAGFLTKPYSLALLSHTVAAVLQSKAAVALAASKPHRH